MMEEGERRGGRGRGRGGENGRGKKAAATNSIKLCTRIKLIQYHNDCALVRTITTTMFNDIWEKKSCRFESGVMIRKLVLFRN